MTKVKCLICSKERDGLVLHLKEHNITAKEYSKLDGFDGRWFSDEHNKKISILKSGKNHPFYGKKFSEEHRKRISKGLKNSWNHENETDKKKRLKNFSGWNKGLTKENDLRVKRNAKAVSKALMGKTFEELQGTKKAKERKKNMSKASLGKPKSKEHAENIRKVRQGKTFEEIFGKEKAAEMLKNLSIAKKGEPIWNAGLTKETDERVYNYSLKIAKTLKGRELPKEVCKKISNAVTMAWKREGQKEYQVQKILKSTMKRPTTPEQAFIDFCKKHELPYKYVGNGEVIIAGINPDFINNNGEKIVVEIQGCYWHGCKVCGFGNTITEIARVRKFAKFGFKTIEIWEHELNNEQLILNKLMAPRQLKEALV